MTDIIAAIIVFLVIFAIGWKMVIILTKSKKIYSIPKGEKEWHEIKFGQGFVVLNWEEMKEWGSLSIDQKSKVATFQQKSLRDGKCKIVVVDGEKRLVTAENFKQVKGEQGKSKN